MRRRHAGKALTNKQRRRSTLGEDRGELGLIEKKFPICAGYPRQRASIAPISISLESPCIGHHLQIPSSPSSVHKERRGEMQLRPGASVVRNVVRDAFHSSHAPVPTCAKCRKSITWDGRI